MSSTVHYLKKLELIFDHAEIGIAILTYTDTGIIFTMVNPTFASIYGYTNEELIGKSPCDILSDNCQYRKIENDTITCTLEDSSFETFHHRKDGTSIPVMVYSKIITDNGITSRIINVIDLSEKKKQKINLQKKESKLSALADNLPGFAYTFRLINHKLFEFIYISHGIRDIFRAAAHEIVSDNEIIFSVIHPDDLKKVQLSFFRSMKNHMPFQSEFRILDSHNNPTWLETRAKPHMNPIDGNIEWHGIVLDITQRKINELRIDLLAYHDPLTWLPNRTFAQQTMEKSIIHAKNQQTYAGLLFIDLDEFKKINDTLGHSFGDDVLKVFSFRLSHLLEGAEILCRLGGDEFLVIIPNITDTKVLEDRAEQLIATLNEPFEVHGHQLHTSASIGISCYPNDGNTFETLLQNADTAMYHAKKSGKNQYSFFNEKMKTALLEHIKIENDLKRALQNGEFFLQYQPQIDLYNHVICGVEALLRWNHPELGLIPPMKFIPIAESSGLIVPIGKWIIEEACRQGAQWSIKGINITIAVNISSIQFTSGNLENVVIQALMLSGLNPQYLELELTESIIIHDVETILKSVQSLKKLGIQLSIDDFGTGYSSLSYLKRFAVDKLKIDQSFIRNILTDQEDAVIVQTIIQMAKKLNLTTIAEGVENQDVLNAINHYGCDEVQGYHFSKPLLPNDFENFYLNFRV